MEQAPERHFCGQSVVLPAHCPLFLGFISKLCIRFNSNVPTFSVPLAAEKNTQTTSNLHLESRNDGFEIFKNSIFCQKGKVRGYKLQIPVPFHILCLERDVSKSWQRRSLNLLQLFPPHEAEGPALLVRNSVVLPSTHRIQIVLPSSAL